MYFLALVVYYISFILQCYFAEGNLAIFLKCTSFALAFLSTFPKEVINITRKMFITANFKILKH